MALPARGCSIQRAAYEAFTRYLHTKAVRAYAVDVNAELYHLSEELRTRCGRKAPVGSVHDVFSTSNAEAAVVLSYVESRTQGILRRMKAVG